ncbi:tyrosine-type recombinase/integrase [Bacillus piscicola]|uniref:tyrosine-type recombinase/integrase n=1 Tax=Bacillus piscicola TaxID=1632684 RepID=UPI001F095412|nr:site-specific integrase [Bacillus piscicola]
MGKRDWNMTPKQQNIYENLWHQAHKIFDWRTHHQGKRGTARYRDGVRSFAKHLAINYGSKNFKNINEGHLRSFVKESQEAGVSAATIKTDLSAVRKLHAMLPKARHKLPDNNDILGAEKRKIVGVDRSWQNREVTKAVHHARIMERKDVEWAIGCARTMGLRIEEATGLTRTQMREALINGHLHLTKTKGGIPRDVPLNQGAKRVLQRILAESKHEKIFTSHGQTHRQAMKSIQNWLQNHRKVFTEKNEQESASTYTKQLGIDVQRPHLTFHGLRHSYARSQYEKATIGGMSANEARLYVAEQLGHGRDDVTRIYLGRK